MALLPWALWAVLLPHVNANWEIGAQGDSCDTTCTNNGGATCSVSGNKQLNSNFEFDYVFADLVSRGLIPAEYSACDSYQRLTDAGVSAQPGTIYFEGYLPPVCYQYSDESTCAGIADGAAATVLRRTCCCLPNPGDDFTTACFVPTTTTSTATTETTTTVTSLTSTTSTTETKTSSTTETTTMTTSMTSTSTTSTSTTSSSTTSTVVTTTYTGTTQTTTSVTATTATMTGTGTESSITVTYTSITSSVTVSSTMTTTFMSTTSSTISTTVVTHTATSVTTSSTTVTTTTSSTTVTQAAQTLVTRVVPAGSSQIPIADRTGFSEGDVILLRNREVVVIENITDDVGGRRLAGDESDSAYGRILSAAVPAILEVDPPVEKAYSPGDSLKNLGPSATYTGSDPITFHGDKKFKFWVPNHQEFLMLETSDLRVFGRTFPGPKSDQQWFGNFRVVLSDDTPVMEVNIKRPAANHSRVTRCSSRRMDSMDVFLGQSKSPLLEMQRRPMEFTAGDDVRFIIDCRQQDRPLLASSRTEYIHFETPSIGFLIVAAHAGNEFPDDWRLQLKYMHLDLLILEMPRKNEFKGILPEIWGIVPRSPEVEAMLSPPETEETELAPRVCQEDRLRQGGSPVCLS